MMRQQVVDRMKTELTHWQFEEGDVSIETLDEVEQALVDACQACKDEVAEEE